MRFKHGDRVQVTGTDITGTVLWHNRTDVLVSVKTDQEKMAVYPDNELTKVMADFVSIDSVFYAAAGSGLIGTSLFIWFTRDSSTPSFTHLQLAATLV